MPTPTNQPSPTNQGSPRQLTRGPWPLPLALGLATLALRWLWIALFASEVPFWDEWDSPLSNIVLPMRSHNLELSNFWLPHNEHRPLVTRLIAALDVSVFGHWSPRRNLILGALIPALSATLWATFWLRSRRHHQKSFLPWLGPLLFASPILWQNLLWSFQVAFPLNALCAIFAFWIAAKPNLRAHQILAIVLLSILASFSLLVGALIPIAASALRLSMLLSTQDSLSRKIRLIESLTLAASGAIIIALFSVDAPNHEALAARGAEDIFNSLWQSLSWPAKPFRGAGLSLWLPILTLLLIHPRRTLRHRAGRWQLALTVFVTLTASALALRRGAGGNGPSPRHAELAILILGPGLYALQELLRIHPKARKILQIWTLAAVLIIASRSVRDLHELKKLSKRSDITIEVLRQSLTIPESEALALLESHSAPRIRPYPNSQRLYSLLQQSKESTAISPSLFQKPQSPNQKIHIPALAGSILSAILSLFIFWRLWKTQSSVEMRRGTPPLLLRN